MQEVCTVLPFFCLYAKSVPVRFRPRSIASKTDHLHQLSISVA